MSLASLLMTGLMAFVLVVPMIMVAVLVAGVAHRSIRRTPEHRSSRKRRTAKTPVEV